MPVTDTPVGAAGRVGRDGAGVTGGGVTGNGVPEGGSGVMGLGMTGDGVTGVEPVYGGGVMGKVPPAAGMPAFWRLISRNAPAPTATAAAAAAPIVNRSCFNIITSVKMAGYPPN
jgi:hypothetical protein